MIKLRFSNGDTMPLLGLGTWRASRDETYNIVFKAIEYGYRHIDCAPIYENEDIIGEAITDAITQGIIKRSDLFITSKLWNDAHLPKDVEPALQKSLRDLQVDYLDLYLIHWPVALKKGVKLPQSVNDFLPIEHAPLLDTWKAMEIIKDKGLCKHIGVSNFNEQHLQTLLSAVKHKPEMNQVELHPYLQQKKLLQFCQKNNIHLTAYAPLGAGKLNDTKFVDILQNPIILQQALQHQCTPANILISWALMRKTVAIPKSSNFKRLKENFEAQKICLSAKNMEEIDVLDVNLRVTSGEVWTINGSPYTSEYLWG
ncbi:MAG: aldo/keto reductase [Bacteroidales bacterium]